MRIVFSAVFALIASIQTASSEQIWLTMDRVEPFKLEQDAESIAVGNPAIADVTVRDSDSVLLFGKSPGLTNIYFFDADGGVIKNLIVRVRTPMTEMVTLHNGTARTTLQCARNCEVTPTIGDDNQVFTQGLAQVQQKVTQADAAGQAAEQ